MGRTDNTEETHTNPAEQSRGTAWYERKNPEGEEQTAMTKKQKTHPNEGAAQHAGPVQQCNGKHAAWGIGNGKPCGGGLDAACCVPTWGNNLFMVTTVNEWES